MSAMINNIDWDWVRILMNEINWHWTAHYENDVINSDYEVHDNLTEWKLLNVQCYRLNKMKNKNMNIFFEKKIIIIEFMIEFKKNFMTVFMLRYLWCLYLNILMTMMLRHLMIFIMIFLLIYLMIFTFILLSDWTLYK